ncbi:hypothetical protein SK571_15325 [Lentzea sp. BCCO 10_0798]|uniref:Uncharacterized protein n=1 Tax=Lentzea kristufekii TaxID=3095430 RepID=A0ABU4TRS9_9PSEU|nr:hypothetical protein [Lentzea sp. BCCO 10_0798]MDX8050759.1 hypothetical protein [Lentzea sp. BCCO 10_0798]
MGARRTVPGAPLADLRHVAELGSRPGLCGSTSIPAGLPAS